MPTFRKVEAIEAVKGGYGFWYHNGVFLAPDRGDGLAPLGYEPAVEHVPLKHPIDYTKTFEYDGGGPNATVTIDPTFNDH